MISGDFNGDGRLDLAVSDAQLQLALDVIAVLLGNGDGTFQTPVRSRGGSLSRFPGGGGLQRRRPTRPGRLPTADLR